MHFCVFCEQIKSQLQIRTSSCMPSFLEYGTMLVADALLESTLCSVKFTERAKKNTALLSEILHLHYSSIYSASLSVFVCSTYRLFAPVRVTQTLTSRKSSKKALRMPCSPLIQNRYCGCCPSHSTAYLFKLGFLRFVPSPIR